METKIVLGLALGAVLALWAGSAQAGWGFREVPQPGYGPPPVINNIYIGGYPYAPGAYYAPGPYYAPRGGWYGNDPHTEAVRRIQATHSRSRVFTHPRSLYNAPPRLDYDPRWYGY